MKHRWIMRETATPANTQTLLALKEDGTKEIAWYDESSRGFYSAEDDTFLPAVTAWHPIIWPEKA